MDKRRKNNVLAGLVVFAFVGMVAVACGKYDKMSIQGDWEIDLKAAKNLKVDSASELLSFKSGSSQKYAEHHSVRDKIWDRWIINGHFERKNNKITFSDRVVDGTGEQKPAVTYKYRIEDDTRLILIVEGEGFANDEKIYTRKKVVE